MARRIKKVPLKRFIIRKLRGAEREFKTKNPIISKEAELGRALISTPRALKRFSRIKKPLLDDPTQLRKKRFKPFFLIAPPGIPVEVKIKRK